MSKNYQKAARGWLYALAAVIAGTCFSASPAQSATCFLPSGECSTGKIGAGPSGGESTPEYCVGYNITEKEYNSKYKNTSCFECSSPCTKTSGGTFYKCEAINNTTWYDKYSVCCTNDTKYDIDDGKCCAGGKCDHPCSGGQQWSPTLKDCVCPSNVETDSNGNCCASGQVLENGACTTPCKMNDCSSYPYASDPGNSEKCEIGCGKGTRYKCKSGYTYSGGKCVAINACPEGYTTTEITDTTIFNVDVTKAGSNTCYKATGCNTNNPFISASASDSSNDSNYYSKYSQDDVTCYVNWPKTIKAKISTKYSLSSGKYNHTISSTDLSFITKGGKSVPYTNIFDKSFEDYMYKDNTPVMMTYVYDADNQQEENTGEFVFDSASSESPFLEFDDDGFHFQHFSVSDTSMKNTSFDWRNDIALRFGSGDYQEATKGQNPLPFNGRMCIGDTGYCKDLFLNLDVSVTYNQAEETRKCSEINGNYINVQDEWECPNPNGYDYDVFELIPVEIGSDGQCYRCDRKKCSDIDSDYGTSDLTCPTGYDVSKVLGYVGSDGQCYECERQITTVVFEFYRSEAESAGDYCEDGMVWSGTEWSSTYSCDHSWCEASHKSVWDINLSTDGTADDFNYKSFTLPFELKLVITYNVPYVYRGNDCRLNPTTNWTAADPMYEPRTVTMTFPAGTKLGASDHVTVTDYAGSIAPQTLEYYINGVKRSSYTVNNVKYTFQEI